MSRFVLSAFGDEIASDLQTQMDILEKHSINYIEMRKVNGKGVEQHALAEIKTIKKQMDARGFKVSAIGSPIGKIKITDDFGPHLELFRHVIEIGKILETNYIRMFSFFIPEGENPVKYRDEVMRRWESFIQMAAGSGLVLLHENEKGIYGDTPERCLDLLQTMDCSYFKAIFDPANFVQCDAETYPKGYTLLKEYLVYLHIKDALYSNHRVVPAGRGDGKVKEILTALDHQGFEGFLSLEPHLALFDGFADLEPSSSQPTLPPGDNPEKFAIAANALKKIILELEADRQR